MIVTEDKLPLIVDGMDFPTYLNDPCEVPSLTSSILRDLLETAPRKVWHDHLSDEEEEKSTTAMNLGTAAHAEFVGFGEAVDYHDHKTWQSNAAKEDYRQSVAAGHTPLLEKHRGKITTMGEEANAQFAICPEIGHMLADAVREQSIFWREGSVWCRCRPDIMTADRRNIIHYKTSGQEINPDHDSAVNRYASGRGWGHIAAHYGAGVEALTGEWPRQFFAVQSQNAPYLCWVGEVTEAFVEQAKKDRLDTMWTWHRCLRSGIWPGHDMRTRIIDVPPWVEQQMIDRKDAAKAARDATRAGEDMYATAMKWQAPAGWRPKS